MTKSANASIDGHPKSFDEETIKHWRFERMMHKAARVQYLPVEPLPNPIFLFEINQLQDNNATRKESFRREMSDFLGLPTDQPLSSDIPHSRPGKMWDPQLEAEKEASKIDICEDEYVEIRRNLLRQSRTAALWIRRVLLPTGRVRVANPDHFDRILDSYLVDPCGPHEKTNSAGKKILKVFDVDAESLVLPPQQDDDDDDEEISDETQEDKDDDDKAK